MKKYKSVLFKKHDLFDQSENDDQKLLYRYEIKTIVDEVEYPDAQDLHILGLTYYETAKDEIDINEAHEYFLAALQENNNYYMARLYSAHCYHDNGDYESALKDYLAVDGDLLKAEFPLWRFVKLQEQIGYCYHKLGKITESKKYFNDILVFYQNEAYDELVDPSEVYECLEETDPIYTNLKKIELKYYGNHENT